MRNARQRSLLGGVLGGALALGLAACPSPHDDAGAVRTSTLPPVPPSGLTIPAAPPGEEQLSAALEAVGRLGSPRGWTRERQDLFRGYLATLEARGPRSRPELFPSPQDVLAYLVNSHIAWTIALASTPEFDTLDIGALRQLPITVDGAPTNLDQLTDEIRRQAPFEPRLALFLNPGWRGVPPWPTNALEGHSFAWQLADQAQRTGRAPGFWELDRQRKVLKVSSFTTYMWGLPGVQPAQVRRVFELVPPPESLRSEILTTCGASLSACSVESLALDVARLWPAKI